ncbi:MAG: flagellin [Blastocatellia bacterium]|nr:flagellin [Blastocatellia bacterium]
MAISLVNNLESLSSQARLSSTGAKLNQTIQRLSSGLRINRSGDDSAGLSIANAFRTDASILNQGLRNANDGLSTLQIIDGGLNTISNLLDRAATLAAQSASDTFTGNRDTLQVELEKVFSEITRQAENIGLGGAGSTVEGRFNKSIGVFIGGGTTATATNNEVTLDLSSSRVDEVGLSLNNLNIGTGSGSVTGGGDISGGITADEVLTFQTVGSSGALTSFTVSLSAGATSSNVIDTINNDVNAQEAGITASLDSSGQLVLTSAEFFTVSSDLAGTATGQTSVAGAAAAADDVAITGAANYTTKTVSAAGAASTQTISFTGTEIGFENTSKNVTFTTSTTAATGAANAAAAVNDDTTLRSAGVFAIINLANSSEVTFVSLKNFNLGISNAGSGSANNNLASQNTTAATAGTLTGGVDGAQDALQAIEEAVSLLGEIQGKVGAGQNNLLQAIDLATSQITNIQAAESRIRDADISAEASNLSRLTVLQQAGVAALAQANQSSQAVLSLLR